MSTQSSDFNDRAVVLNKYRMASFSWSAVLVGALVGIGISFLFNLFGSAIGLAAFANSTSSNQTLAIGGIIGLAIIAIFSMGTAGWVAGHLGAVKNRFFQTECGDPDAPCNHGVLYGFTAWCVALLLMVLLSGPMTHFVSHAMKTLGSPSIAMLAQQQNAWAQKAAPNVGANSAMANVSNPSINAQAGNAQDAASGLALRASVAFGLFFVGAALSACLAGHWGYASCSKYGLLENRRW